MTQKTEKVVVQQFEEVMYNVSKSLTSKNMTAFRSHLPTFLNTLNPDCEPSCNVWLATSNALIKMDEKCVALNLSVQTFFTTQPDTVLKQHAEEHILDLADDCFEIDPAATFNALAKVLTASIAASPRLSVTADKILSFAQQRLDNKKCTLNYDENNKAALEAVWAVVRKEELDPLMISQAEKIHIKLQALRLVAPSEPKSLLYEDFLKRHAKNPKPT